MINANLCAFWYMKLIEEIFFTADIYENIGKNGYYTMRRNHMDTKLYKWKEENQQINIHEEDNNIIMQDQLSQDNANS